MKHNLQNLLLTVFLSIVGMFTAENASAATYINLSSIAPNEELTLTEETHIYLDVDRTLKSIKGDYSLYVAGPKKLTVSASNTPVEVTNLNVDSGEMEVSCTSYNKEAVLAYFNVSVSGKLTVNSKEKWGTALKCLYNDITVYKGGTLISNGAVKCELGDVTVNGTLTVTTDNSTGVHAPNGNVKITWKADITTGYMGIEANYIEFLYPTVTINADTYGTYSHGDIYIAGRITSNGRAAGIYATGDINIESSYSVNASSDGKCEDWYVTDAGGNVTRYGDAYKGFGIRSDGNITIKGGTVDAYGKKFGIYAARAINITSNAQTVTAKSDNYAMGFYSLTYTNQKIMTPVNGKVSSGNYSYNSMSFRTILDSSSKVAKEAVIGLPNLSGAVKLDASTIVPGQWVRYKVTGDAASLTSVLKERWEVHDGSEWTTVTPYEKGVYVATANDVGKYLRVVLSADGYHQTLTSPQVYITKSACLKTPEKAVVELFRRSRHYYLLVINARTDQEYVCYSQPEITDESVWENALTPTADGTLTVLTSEIGSIHTYVHTRMKETETTFASKSVYTQYPEEAHKKGDVNCDKEVNISDVVALINTIAGNNTFRSTSDVNGDGDINISDVVAVINIIAGV